MTFITTLLAFILALAILIAFHELGHYWAARLCGVKVLRFSIGFGKVLWSRVTGADRTEWALCAIPLGGYVRMVDEREGQVSAADAPRAFNRQPVWRRFVIVAAGPIANFALALLLYWFLYMWGVPGVRPVLGTVPAASAAAAAGLASHDTVLRVNGRPTDSWSAFEDAVDAGARAPLRLDVRDASGHVRAVRLPATDSDHLQTLGVNLWLPANGTVIGYVDPDGVAAAAGIEAGDRIVAVNGVPTTDWDALVAAIRPMAGHPVRLLLARGARRFEQALVPAAVQEDGVAIGRIGVGPQPDPAVMRQLAVTVRAGPLRALRLAARQVYDVTALSLDALGRLITGRASMKTLSGPLTIADFAGKTARQGVVPYVTFLALVSISLGFMNLLPVPVLDGGHLMYYMAEVIKGSPVSERAVEVGQRIGIALLLLLMACAFYNDLSRMLTGF